MMGGKYVEENRKKITSIYERLLQGIMPIWKPSTRWKDQGNKDIQKWNWKSRTLESKRSGGGPLVGEGKYLAMAFSKYCNYYHNLNYYY